MLTVLREESGQLLAVCEWWCVNATGLQDWSCPEHPIWVEQIEVSRGAGRTAIQRIIDTIATLRLEAPGCYWVRRDKPGSRKLHAYRRSQMLTHTLQEVA